MAGAMKRKLTTREVTTNFRIDTGVRSEWLFNDTAG
jgi:hypothetical protein